MDKETKQVQSNRIKKYVENEQQDQLNMSGYVRNIQNEGIINKNLEETDHKIEVYRSFFMDINIDAVYDEVDLKRLSKKILYLNLQNVKIYINSCSLRQINFAYLNEAFNQFKQLKKLEIFLHREGNMNPNSYKELGNLLKQVKTLQELSICIEINNQLNLKALNGLCEGIKQVSEVNNLRLIIKQQQYSKMSKQYIECIGSVLKELKQLIELTLYLSCQSNDNSFNLEISKSLVSLQCLQKFILVIHYDQPNRQASPKGVIAIFQSLNSLKQLHHFAFSMKNISVNPAILEEAFRFLPILQSFTFFTKYSVTKNQILKIKTKRCLQKIFPCIVSYFPLRVQQSYSNVFKNLNKIENISFSTHDFGDEGLKSLGEELKNCTSMNSISILINPEAQENTVKIIHPKDTDSYEFHEDYVCYNNELADAGISSLANGLAHLTNLRQLNFQIDRLRISENGVEQLKNSFKKLVNLNSLTIKMGSNYSGKGSQFRLFMEGIQKIISLQFLEIEIEQFICSTQNTEGLASYFKNLQKLTTFHLGFSKNYNLMVEDNQIRCFGDIFEHLSQLTNLKLSISYPLSASMISDNLLLKIKNVQTLHLEICDPEMDRQNLQSFALGLQQCSQLQHLLFKFQSNKDDFKIFEKYFNKIILKKIKYMPKLVKYSSIN